MNLYELIAANTAALEANTKALLGGGAGATGSTEKASAKAGAKTGTTSKPKGPTREELVTALTEVKEKFGAAEAKAIITKLGAAKMAEITDGKIAEGFKLAQSKLEATDDGDDGAGDDDI